MDLDAGSVALVTGAGGGIGAAVVERLRAEGLTVVASDLAASSAGADARVGADVVLDVTDREACRAVVADVVAEHGRLDLLVAAHGIAVAGLADEVADEVWDRCLRIDLDGTVHIVRAAYAAMIPQGRGHLVALASLAGLGPAALLVPYGTAKGGVVSLMTSLRPEAARHGIGVSVVCPGPVDTGMLDDGGTLGHVELVDARRYLTDVGGKPISPAEVAAAVWRGIASDTAVITPGRAGLFHLVGRLLPGLVDRQAGRSLAKELRRTSR